MNISKKRTKYMSSIVYGYLLVFAFILPLSGLVISGSIKSGIVFFPIALMFAIPVAVVAYGVGFPVFQLIQKLIKANYFIVVMIAGVASAVVCASLVITIFMLFNQNQMRELSNATLLFLLPTICVSAISSGIFWWRTKSNLIVDCER